MIQVDDLEIAFHGNYLFQGATFSLQEGEKCGLVGRNGSGKSTLFRLLTKEEVPDGGTISLPKHYSIGILNQHIHFQKETLLEEACLGLRKGEEDCVYKAETILFGLGFKKEDLERPISSFSGGYQLRLHLAKVLIAEPNCLLLDEPTNYLDIVSIRWFTRFLQQWKGEFVLISHDREFMDSVTTHTMGIHRQKLRKIKGSTVSFYEQIMLEEEIHEKTRLSVDKKRAQAQNFIDRFGAKAAKAAQAQSRQKMLDREPVLEKLKEISELEFEFNTAFFPSKKMLEVNDISFSYKEGVEIVHKLSLMIEKGDRIAIVGKNGRGKSTILKLLAKEVSPDTGEVKHSENLSIGYFGQTNIDRLHPLNSIEEEIGASNKSLNRTQIKSICGLMMFSGDQANKTTAVLSGGEKSRVLLGKIIAKPCNLLLLDEPTHHLDMESIEALIDALENFEGAVILVTHSELILKRLNFDKIVVCHKGRQDLFIGNYEAFLEKDGWHDAHEKNPSKAKKTIGKTSSNEGEKSLKAIEKEISDNQDEIEVLDQEQGLLQEELSKVVQDTNSAEAKKEKMKTLSSKIAVNQRKIDRLYEELDTLYKML